MMLIMTTVDIELSATFALAVLVATTCSSAAAASKVCWLTVTFGASSDGGDYVEDVSKEEACYKYCIAHPETCQAVDFVVDFGQCWSHRDTLYTRPSTHCRRFEYTCNHNGNCTDSFEKVSGLAPSDPPAGILEDVESATECRTQCLASDVCKRYVSSSSGDENVVCIMYTTWNEEFVRSTDTDLFLRKSCLRSIVHDPQPLDTVVDDNEPSPDDEVKHAESRLTTISEKQLQPICWLTVAFGANSNYLEPRVEVDGVSTADACAQYCISHSATCQAVDFLVADSACYSHPNTFDTSASSRCIRYEYTCNHGKNCTDSFVTQPDVAPTDASNGRLQPGITRADYCRALCLANPDCKRVVSTNDSLPEHSRVCYLFMTWGDELVHSPGAVLYVRRKCLLSHPQPTDAQARPPSPTPVQSPSPEPAPAPAIADVDQPLQPVSNAEQYQPADAGRQADNAVYRGELHNRELRSMQLSLHPDPSDPWVGDTLVVRHRPTVSVTWTVDESTHVLRTSVGGLCIHPGHNNILQLATCDAQTDMFRYFGSGNLNIARNVSLGSSSGLQQQQPQPQLDAVAVWDNELLLYEPGIVTAMYARPFESNGADMGAQWAFNDEI